MPEAIDAHLINVSLRLAGVVKGTSNDFRLHKPYIEIYSRIEGLAKNFSHYMTDLHILLDIFIM